MSDPSGLSFGDFLGGTISAGIQGIWGGIKAATKLNFVSASITAVGACAIGAAGGIISAGVDGEDVGWDDAGWGCATGVGSYVAGRAGTQAVNAVKAKGAAS